MVDPISASLKGAKLLQMIKTLPTIYKILNNGTKLILDEQRFVQVFEQYFDRVYTKYYYANTLLMPNSKVKLEDIYHPAIVFPVGKKTQDDMVTIVDYPDHILGDNDRLLVKDSAGMGKSTLLRQIFLKAIDRIDVGHSQNCKIPILIDLRKMEKHKSLENVIFNEILEGEKKEFAPSLFQLFDSGRFVFLFDGFDEISRNNYESAILEIKQFTEKYFRNNFVITSRDEPILNSLSSFLAFKIKGLDEQNATELVKKYCGCLNEDFLAEKLLAELRNENNRTLFRLLENPLMVCLLVVAYNSKNKIPLKKVDFYDQVFDALFEKHDLTKNTSFDRVKQSGLGRAEFCSLLRCVAIIGLLHYEGKVEYSRGDITSIVEKAKGLSGKDVSTDAFINDLTSAVPLFTIDGHYFRWIHKSFMDYYAASWLYYDSHVDMEKIKESVFRNIKSNFNLITLYYELNEIDVAKRLFKPLFSEYAGYVSSTPTELTGFAYKLHGLHYFSGFQVKSTKVDSKSLRYAASSHTGKNGVRQTEWHHSNIILESSINIPRKDVLDLAKACKLPIFSRDLKFTKFLWNGDVNFIDSKISSEAFEPLSSQLIESVSSDQAEFLIAAVNESLDLRQSEISHGMVLSWLKSVDERIESQNKIKLI